MIRDHTGLPMRMPPGHRRAYAIRRARRRFDIRSLQTIKDFGSFLAMFFGALIFAAGMVAGALGLVQLFLVLFASLGAIVWSASFMAIGGLLIALGAKIIEQWSKDRHGSR